MAVDGAFYFPLFGRLKGDTRIASKCMLHPEGIKNLSRIKVVFLT